MSRPGAGIAFALALLGVALAFAPEAPAQDYVGQVAWGTRGDGPGEFVHPYDVEVDEAGQVYVSDFANHRIQVFDRDGTFLRMWGTYGGAPGEFYCPTALAFGPDGLLHVADLLNARVQVFTREGDFVREWPVRWGGNEQERGMPYGLAVEPDGRVLVADLQHHCIAVHASDGAWLAQWGPISLPTCLLQLPSGIALDGSGSLFIADQSNYVCVYDPGGSCFRRWACDYPRGVAIAPDGRVFVSTGIDVRVFTPAGALITSFSESGFGPWEVNEATGVALTAAGEVYVADNGNHRIQRWGPVPTPAQAGSWGRLKTHYR